jgi:hypothetical protein
MPVPARPDSADRFRSSEVPAATVIPAVTVAPNWRSEAVWVPETRSTARSIVGDTGPLSNCTRSMMVGTCARNP